MAGIGKKIAVLTVAAAGAYLFFANESGHDLRRRSSKLLRDGSRVIRRVADGLEHAAISLDTPYESDYVNDEWQKLDQLREVRR